MAIPQTSQEILDVLDELEAHNDNIKEAFEKLEQGKETAVEKLDKEQDKEKGGREI